MRSIETEVAIRKFNVKRKLNGLNCGFKIKIYLIDKFKPRKTNQNVCEMS